MAVFVLAGCNLATSPGDSVATTASTDAGRLVVAWAQGGNLVVWQAGDAFPRRVASGGVIQPYIAPDGETIAFTRGPNGAPETLWVVDVAGTAEQQLVGDARPRGYQPGLNQLGDIAWFDADVLYFNTLRQATPLYAPRNDLYRANARTREVALILPAGEGGRMTISPDKDWIAVVYPGTYGRQDGRISVVDPLALQPPRHLLFFVGVATGSEAAFYPPVRWLPDSSALLSAIPDRDLVYSDAATAQAVPPTRIWRLPIATPSDRQLLNSVRASFFGLPAWSPDAGAMTYLQRSPGTNTFTLFIADYNGDRSRAFLVGEIGSVEQPRWLPDSQRFIFVDPQTRAHFNLGSLDGTIVPLTGQIIFEPKFVNDNTFVYVEPSDEGNQLAYQTIGNLPERIGEIGHMVPLYDALMPMSVSDS